MKLEQNAQAPLFSNTQIPDIFFSEYLSSANGDYIKIYLYILFLSKYDKDIKLNDLSKKLVLPLKVIQDAIKYWEDAGVLTKKTTGYIINDLQEIELHKLYKPKTSLSAEQLQKSAEDQKRAQSIEYINNKYFSGLMPLSWYPDIELWFSKYGFDEEVMIALFNYCFNKAALNRSYIQTVAEAWASNKIKTFSDLDNYYERQEKINVIIKSITKKLSLNRQLSQYERAYVEKWVLDFSYSLDIIEIALKKTTSKVNPNFDYLNKLISDWYDKGLKTPEQVQKYISDMKVKQKNVQNLQKATGYNQYNQRNYDNLDDFYVNKPIENLN